MTQNDSEIPVQIGAGAGGKSDTSGMSLVWRVKANTERVKL